MARGDEVAIHIKVKEAAQAQAELAKVERKVDDLGDSGNRAQRGLADFNVQMTSMRNIMKLVKPAALITGLGLAAQAAGAASAGVLALGGALAPAAGGLIAFPAALGAAAQGMGVLKLATAGVGDAVGGLNEEMNPEKLAALSPPAREFATTLDGLRGPVTRLQTMLQRNLFGGLSEGLKVARPAFGALRRELPATATVMGALGQRAGVFVNALYRSGDLTSVLRLNNSLIGTLGNAGFELANAFRHVFMAGIPLIQWMAQGAGHFARLISNEAAAARESGRLATFFHAAQVAMSRIGRIGADIAVVFWNIAKAGTGLGGDMLTSLVKGAEALKDWSESAKGQQQILTFFKQAKAPLFEMGRLIRDVTKAFVGMGGEGGSAGLTEIIRKIRVDLLPVLVRVTKSTTAAFSGPAVDAIVAFGKAMEPFLGASGPVILLVKGFTLLANGVTAFTNAVPGGSAMMTTMVGGFATLKAIGLVSMASQFMGMGRGVNTLKGAFASLKAMCIGTRIQLALLRAQMIIMAIVTRVVTVATKAWAIAMRLVNLAMRMNPIGLIITGIMLLVAGVILAYKRFGWFRAGVQAVWGGIKAAFNAGLSVAKTVFNFLKSAAVGAFNKLKSAAGGLKSALSGIWDGMKSAFKSVINTIIGWWNNFNLTINIPDAIPGLPGEIKIETPNIGTLAQGGIVRRGGAWIAGERGPELGTFSGSSVKIQPLTGPDAVSLGGAGGLGGMVTVPVYLDSRQIALAQGDYNSDRIARSGG